MGELLGFGNKEVSPASALCSQMAAFNQVVKIARKL
jgi:hypothetical protein